MIREELQRLKQRPRDLRNFGWMVGLVLAVLGAWLAFRGRPAAPWLWGPGLALILCGWITPGLLRPIHRAWMTLGLVLGLIVSTMLLTVFYYAVLTPLGLCARILGKDFLGLKLDSNAATYWIRRPPSSAPDALRAERQF